MALISTGEAAKRLGMSRQSVNLKIRLGQIKARKLTQAGGTWAWMIEEREVERLRVPKPSKTQ